VEAVKKLGLGGYHKIFENDKEYSRLKEKMYKSKFVINPSAFICVHLGFVYFKILLKKVGVGAQ